MNIFVYKYIDEYGVINKGTIKEESREAARQQLNLRDSITLISIEPISSIYVLIEKLKEKTKNLFKPKLNPNDLLYFTRELYSFSDAGLSITETLTILLSFVKKRNIRRLIEEILEKLRKGYLFSEILAMYPESFSHGYVATIKGGEESGEIQGVLKDNYDYLDWKAKVLKRIGNLATFPLIIIFVLLGVFYVMLFFLVPRIVPFLTRSGREIPKMTQIMITLSNFVGAYQKIFFICLGITIFGILFGLTQPKLRYYVDRLFYRLPLVGDLYMLFTLMTFSKIFYILNKSGTPIIDSLNVCKKLFQENGYFEVKIETIIVNIKRGRSFGKSMDLSKVFPDIYVQMVSSAEQTGTLSEKLESLGKLYGNQLDYKISDALAFVEPVYISIVCFYIMVLLFGFYIPMISVAVPN